MKSRCIGLTVVLLSAGQCFCFGQKPRSAATRRFSQPLIEDVLKEATVVNDDKRRILETKFKSGHVSTRKAAIRPKKTKTGFKLKFPSGTPIPTPTIAGGKLYVSGGFSSKEFYCFNATTGKQIWAVDLDDDGPTAAVIADGTVILNTESCTLFALDAKTGKMRWSHYLGDPLLSTPMVANGRVYTVYPVPKSRDYQKFDKSSKKKGRPIRLYTHALIGMDLKTGKILWQRWVDTDCMTAPVASGRDLFVTTLSGTLFRFQQLDGKLLSAWRMRATSVPIVVGNRLFLTCRADRGKGKGITEAIVRQTSKLPAQFLSGSYPAPYLDRRIQEKAESTRNAGKFEGMNGIGGGFGGGFGFGSGSNGSFGSGFFSVPDDSGTDTDTDTDENGRHLTQFAQPQPTPKKVGQKKANAAELPADLLVLTERRAANTIGQGNVSMLQMYRGSRLLFWEGRLFNCMGNVLNCTNPRTGGTIWQRKLKGNLKKLGGHLATSPIVARERLVVATLQGDLLELAPRTGRILSRHRIGSKIRFPPIVNNGRIYVGTLDGQVVCIKTQDPKPTPAPVHR